MSSELEKYGVRPVDRKKNFEQTDLVIEELSEVNSRRDSVASR